MHARFRSCPYSSVLAGVLIRDVIQRSVRRPARTKGTVLAGVLIRDVFQRTVRRPARTRGVVLAVVLTSVVLSANGQETGANKRYGSRWCSHQRCFSAHGQETGANKRCGSRCCPHQRCSIGERSGDRREQKVRFSLVSSPALFCRRTVRRPTRTAILTGANKRCGSCWCPHQR